MLFETIGLSARLTFGLIALALAGVILLLIRRNAIREKYVILWLPLGMAFLASSLFPELLVALSARVHLHYITVVLLGVILVFTTILLYFTARLSQLREDVKKLAQEIALSHVVESPALPPASQETGEGWLPAKGAAPTQGDPDESGQASIRNSLQ